MDDLDVEMFYMLDGAKGSSIFWATRRQSLWERSSPVSGRERVVEIAGRLFGRATFHVDAGGMTKNNLVVLKVFGKPTNRGYNTLGGFTIQDLRNSEFPVGHGVINPDKDMSDDRSFALPFIRANDPSILTLCGK